MCSPNLVILGDIAASQNKLQLFKERLFPLRLLCAVEKQCVKGELRVLRFAD